MKVIDHEPTSWFLLQDGDQLYFDVHCSHSFVGYSVLVALDEDETSTLHQRGRRYLDQLAEDINFSAPVAGGDRSPYKARDLSRTHGQRVTEAVMSWQSGR